MATRSLRQRSSRYSSPATFGEKEARSKPVEVSEIRNGQQTSLDGWVEPVVRPAVPSFEDTKGLERLGVLENMQPLGVPPSQRLLQKLKLTPYVRPSPRTTALHVDEVVPSIHDSEKLEMASTRDSARLSTLPPDTTRLPDTIVISSPPRGRPSMKDVANMPQAPNFSPSPIKSTFVTPSSQFSPKPVSIQEHLRQDRLNTHVEHAVQEAQERGTPNLVMGLRRLRDDAHVIPDLWNVLEAVIAQSATHKQFRTFKRYIKSGVKSFRRTSQVSESPQQPEHLGREESLSPVNPGSPMAHSWSYIPPPQTHTADQRFFASFLPPRKTQISDQPPGGRCQLQLHNLLHLSMHI